jgi:hypothetical protein
VCTWASSRGQPSLHPTSWAAVVELRTGCQWGEERPWGLALLCHVFVPSLLYIGGLSPPEMPVVKGEK